MQEQREGRSASSFPSRLRRGRRGRGESPLSRSPFGEERKEEKMRVFLGSWQKKKKRGGGRKRQFVPGTKEKRQGGCANERVLKNIKEKRKRGNGEVSSDNSGGKREGRSGVIHLKEECV